jgi:hypothetical protein
MHPLQVHLALLGLCDLVLKAGKALAICNFFLLNVENGYKNKSYSQAQDEDCADWDKRPVRHVQSFEAKVACHNSSSHQHNKKENVHYPGNVHFPDFVNFDEVLCKLLFAVLAHNIQIVSYFPSNILVKLVWSDGD